MDDPSVRLEVSRIRDRDDLPVVGVRLQKREAFYRRTNCIRVHTVRVSNYCCTAVLLSKSLPDIPTT